MLLPTPLSPTRASLSPGRIDEALDIEEEAAIAALAQSLDTRQIHQQVRRDVKVRAESS